MFEHPAFAKSWTEDALQQAAQLPNVVFARGDMCRWGLNGASRDTEAQEARCSWAMTQISSEAWRGRASVQLYIYRVQLKSDPAGQGS